MYNGKYWFGALIAFLVDLSTKSLCLKYLQLENEFYMNKNFSIQRIWNESNILANVSFPIENWIFRTLWICFAIGLALTIYWISNKSILNDQTYKTDFAKTGLFLIMGGIFGNCYDRVFRIEGVVDFIRLNFVDSIPIMNFADIFIYVGLLCILFSWGLILCDIILNINKKVA